MDPHPLVMPISEVVEEAESSLAEVEEEKTPMVIRSLILPADEVAEEDEARGEIRELTTVTSVFCVVINTPSLGVLAGRIRSTTSIIYLDLFMPTCPSAPGV